MNKSQNSLNCDWPKIVLLVESSSLVTHVIQRRQCDHIEHNFTSLCPFLRVCVEFGHIMNLLWQIFNAIANVQNFICLNGHTLRKRI